MDASWFYACLDIDCLAIILFAHFNLSNDQVAQRNQGQNVGDHYQLIEGIGQLPDQIVGEQTAEKMNTMAMMK